MTPLRQRMLEDVRLAGLAPSTQQEYVDAVRSLAAFWKQSPDLLTEEQVREYFRHLIEVKKVAPGTFRPIRCGILFFYENTLNRQWLLFKSESGCPRGSGCRTFYPTTKSGCYWAA